MIAQLTRNERQLAILISLVVAVVGLMLGIAGRNDPIGLHGALIFVAGLLVIALIGRDYLAPEPSEDRLTQYYDDPTRAGIVLAMIWVVLGLAIGDWVAWQLVEPDLTFGQAWSSFGRLRPVHTTAVIFGFGGNGLIATSLYLLQRTSRARLPDQLSPWFVLVGYNLFCVLAVTGYLIGITQSKEYAEPEWYADIWLVIVWVTYLLIYLRTLARRKEAAYLRLQLVLHGLHPGCGDAAHRQQPRRSCLLRQRQDLFAVLRRAGRHDAAVAFFLTSGFLGMMYYFLPARAGRPIFSYRLSIISFWGITFFYMWAGSHHLHYTALPQWVQTRHDVFADAPDPVLGLGRQRAADFERRLAQGA
jgi:cytochrome c oxidase cbb3-type subunit I